jgi:hypothetical protein
MANENANFFVLVPNGDGHTIVAYSSTSRYNTFVFKPNQQLATLFQQAKFWAPWDQKSIPWAFFRSSIDEPMSFKIEHAFHYILCHLVPLNTHVLRSKNQGRKGLISYKTENGSSTMKKHCETKYSNILKMYLNEIIHRQCSIE